MFIEVDGCHIRNHGVVISYHDPHGSAVLSYALVAPERRSMSASEPPAAIRLGTTPAVVGATLGHDAAQSLPRVRQS
jgi:hypothetical protein